MQPQLIRLLELAETREAFACRGCTSTCCDGGAAGDGGGSEAEEKPDFRIMAVLHQQYVLLEGRRAWWCQSQGGKAENYL